MFVQQQRSNLTFFFSSAQRIGRRVEVVGFHGCHLKPDGRRDGSELTSTISQFCTVRNTCTVKFFVTVTLFFNMRAKLTTTISQYLLAL